MSQIETLPAPPALSTVTLPRPAPRWLAISVACLFAGLIPETIATSSTSVMAIVANPFQALFIGVFYGTAMLVVREAIVRKPASWVTVLLLSIAFGWCNEGVVAGTWYRADVRPQGYLFFGPFDIAWAVALTVFHIFISMMATVAFTDILFPSYRGRSLLGQRGIVVTAAIFIVFTGLLALAPTFRPYRLIVFGAALVLATIALLLPPRRPRTPSIAPLPRLWTLRVAGFLAYFGYFFAIYFVPVVTAGLPHLGLVNAQFVDIAIMVLFTAGLLVRGISWMRRQGWGMQQNLALITGALAFEMIITLLASNQIAIWEPLATVPFFVALLLLARRLQRREAKLPQPMTAMTE
jgi:hypothetical protein